MYKKVQYTIFNILLLCVAFGLLFFVKINSYADVVRDDTFHVTSYNGTNSTSPYISSFDLPQNMRVCFYYSIDGYYEGAPYGNYSLFTNYNGNVPLRRYVNGQTQSGYFISSLAWEGVYILTAPGSIGAWGNNRLSVYSDYGTPCPIFYDLEDCRAYIVNGYMPTKPFDDSIKLDGFRVYSKGEFNLEFMHVGFNQIIVKPIWSNPDITEVEVSVYALNPEFNYNPVNYTYGQFDSGMLHSFDISGLTLHGQKFVVRATPYTRTNKGVSIAYEMVFPDTFDQPLGDLVIKEPNTYPFGTIMDISGNEVPIEWTVTQTPIYIYETNNVENYYYGEPVSYPVPEITENTTNNYYEEYINNYYNDYSTVVQNYNTTFDVDITDVSSGDIQNSYDDIGNFFKGFGGFIGKLALLFNGLFPFLSASVSVVLVTMVGIIVLGAIVILFLKVLHIL